MTINSLYSSSATAYANSSTSTSQTSQTQAPPQGPPPGPPPNGGAGGPSSDQMKAVIAKLKETDPTLAAKLEKVNSTLEELKKSGVSQQDAMKQIQDEFGKPTDSEMKEIGSVMQQLQTGHQVDTTA